MNAGTKAAIGVAALLWLGGCASLLAIEDGEYQADSGPPNDADTDGSVTDSPLTDSTTTTDGCATAEAASTAAPYTNFIWALWPLAKDSPGSSNYTVTTICGDKVVTDKTTGLMWAQAEEPGTYSWADAKTRCAASRRAGFTDWRLPTRVEVVSLVDFGKASAPTIDTTVFPGATSGAKWSSSPYALAAGNAWSVAFGFGSTTFVTTTTAYGARCVR